MLKTVMLVSAFALSVPALAQDQTTTANPATTVPATPQAAPMDGATAQTAPTTAAQGAPIPGAPVADQTAATPQTAPAEPVAADVAAAPAAPAAGEPAAAVTGATQIAQVVNTEFPTYDKNADTNLDKGEFGAWMVALKSASDPATKAGDPATVKWIDGAFASADTDKSKAVSKDELTKYLSQGAE